MGLVVARPAAKAKSCKVCKSQYIPQRQIQAWCSPSCAVELAKVRMAKAKQREKADEARQDRKKREAMKTRGQWLREAQSAFNAWVRARDAHLPCVSCGRHHQGKWNAGHYLSVGARPELRFEPLNVWKQCEPCNTHLSGNLILYRAQLVKRIGLEKVEWLEGHHDPLHLSVDDIKAVIAEYRAKAKELEKRNGR